MNQSVQGSHLQKKCLFIPFERIFLPIFFVAYKIALLVENYIKGCYIIRLSLLVCLLRGQLVGEIGLSLRAIGQLVVFGLLSYVSGATMISWR